MSSGKFENVGSFQRDCSGTKLLYDQACLLILANKNVTFWSQYEECEDCMLLQNDLSPSNTLVLNTLSRVHYQVRSYEEVVCSGTYQFAEFGHYQIITTETPTCQPHVTLEPNATYLPIIGAIVILLSMASVWYIMKGISKRIIAGRLYARYFARKANELGSASETARVPRSPISSRLRSLDTFRGLAIAVMIFVNAGGGGYDVFSHSVWNGLTVADVVFPWFAFAMGESLVLSLNARLTTSMPRWTALGQVAIRSLKLALIGIFLGSVSVLWTNVRLPGVLQRLAAMYFIIGAAECAFMKISKSVTPGRSLFRDIAAGWPQWLVTLLLVSVQVCVSLLVAAPGCPRGYAGPGGLHRSALGGPSLANCTGGIAGYIDRMVLGESHLYKGNSVYHATVPHDPHGLLGVLSGVLVVQAGAHATRVMLVYNQARARIMRWVFWSIIFGLAGGGLCSFTKNGGPIPINIYLWSISYCLVTSSMAFFIQAVLYFIVDLKTKWSGRPLYYAGQNALILFVGSELLKNHFPFHWPIHSPTHTQLLAVNTATMLMWLVVAVALHRHRILIKL